jgi:hypothetical protein
MPEKSIEHPMPSLVNANRVINELYGSNPNQKIPKKTIVDAAAKAPIVPDVMTYFTHLEDKSYTKQELIDSLNAQVKARHREEAVGLFGVGRAEEEARRQMGMKKQA